MPPTLRTPRRRSLATARRAYLTESERATGMEGGEGERGREAERGREQQREGRGGEGERGREAERRREGSKGLRELEVEGGWRGTGSSGSGAGSEVCNVNCAQEGGVGGVGVLPRCTELVWDRSMGRPSQAPGEKAGWSKVARSAPSE